MMVENADSYRERLAVQGAGALEPRPTDGTPFKEGTLTKPPFPVHSYPFFISDWRESETRLRLTLAERAIHSDLISYAYREGSIPKDHKTLAQIASCTEREIAKAWPSLASSWNEREDGRLHNSKVDAVLTDMIGHRAKQSEAGRRGNERRWATRSQPDRNPIATRQSGDRHNSRKTSTGAIASSPLLSYIPTADAVGAANNRDPIAQPQQQPPHIYDPVAAGKVLPAVKESSPAPIAEAAPVDDGIDRHVLARKLVDEILPRHPGGGGRDVAVLALSMIIANPDPLTDDERRWTADCVGTCNQIRNAHRVWLENLASGTGNGFQRRMTLNKWISDRDWLRVPFETTDQQVMRAIREVTRGGKNA